jgi:hypothetical protein
VANSNGTLWVSWNGATEVRDWAVYGADTEDALGDREGRPQQQKALINGLHSLKPLVGKRRDGFETKIELRGEKPAYVKVAALDKRGELVGCTETIWIGSHLDLWYKDQVSFLTLSSLLV